MLGCFWYDDDDDDDDDDVDNYDMAISGLQRNLNYSFSFSQEFTSRFFILLAEGEKGQKMTCHDLPIEQVSLISLLAQLEKLLVPFNRLGVYSTFSRPCSSDGDREDVDGDGVDDVVVEQNAVPDSLTLNQGRKQT